MPRWTEFVLCLFSCLLLQACQTTSPSPYQSSEEQASGIAGSVVNRQATPVPGAFVYAYRNPRSNLRGPADFEAMVDDTGRYFLDLVEGNYHLVARWRKGGADVGPPRAGDFWALPDHNPVTVNRGSITHADFVLQGIAQPRLLREGTRTSGETGFTGLLLTAGARPVAGAFVIANAEPDFQHMPETTSPAVGEDGRFTLYVDRPGRWCLAARIRTRGQPAQGELYGLLEGENSCRSVQTGEIVDIGTITLHPYRR